MFLKLVCVGLGGALGSIARYVLGDVVQGRLGPQFPYGTLAVNLLGSFGLAFLMALGTQSEVLTPNVRLGLTAGVMGGFTTYSTFSYETMRQLHG